MQILHSIPPLPNSSMEGLSLSQPKQPQASAKTSFKNIFAELKSAFNKSVDLPQSAAEFQDAVIKGKALSARELLVFQIQASQFAVHVELLSKAIESGLSAVRKLQQSQ